MHAKLKFEIEGEFTHSVASVSNAIEDEIRKILECTSINPKIFIKITE